MPDNPTRPERAQEEPDCVKTARYMDKAVGPGLMRDLVSHIDRLIQENGELRKAAAKSKEAIVRIIARVALVSPYYELAREAELAIDAALTPKDAALNPKQQSSPEKERV